MLAGGVTHRLPPAEEFSWTITRESERWEKLIAAENIRIERLVSARGLAIGEGDIVKILYWSGVPGDCCLNGERG